MSLLINVTVVGQDTNMCRGRGTSGECKVIHLMRRFLKATIHHPSPHPNSILLTEVSQATSPRIRKGIRDMHLLVDIRKDMKVRAAITTTSATITVVTSQGGHQIVNL